MLRPFARIAAYLFLIASLALPGIAMPARAAAQAWQAASVAMPSHDGMDMPGPVTPTHCQKGCCPQQACDMTACIATGCLPQFTSLPAVMVVVPFTFSWHSITPPAPLAETPLRPPIA